MPISEHERLPNTNMQLRVWEDSLGHIHPVYIGDELWYKDDRYEGDLGLSKEYLSCPILEGF